MNAIDLECFNNKSDDGLNKDKNCKINTDGLFEIIRFNNSKNTALKVNMFPSNSTTFSKDFNIGGKKGDLYHLSFWCKNEGIEADDMLIGNAVILKFKPSNHEDSLQCMMPSSSFFPAKGIWQYFSYKFIAEYDYDSLTLMFTQGRNANSLYVTNICLYKDIASNFYTYDVNGNVIGIKNQSYNLIDFKYNKDNRLIDITTPRGANFRFEYDNLKKDKIINSISSTGISNKIKYDDNENPVLTKISKSSMYELGERIYKIKNRKLNKYLILENERIVFSSMKDNGGLFRIDEVTEEDVRVVSFDKPDYYLICFMLMVDGIRKALFTNNDDTIFKMHSYFKLKKHKNGSYNILFKFKRLTTIDTNPVDFFEEYVLTVSKINDLVDDLDGNKYKIEFVSSKDVSLDSEETQFYFEFDDKVVDNNLYKIRCKGTNDYLTVEDKNLVIKEDKCSNTLWKLEKNMNDEIRFVYGLIPEYHIKGLLPAAYLSNKEDSDKTISYFMLNKTNNGSYTISSAFKSEDNLNYYLRQKDGIIRFEEFQEDPSFEFYLELKEEEFIETKATYTDDGRFVSGVTDSNFNKTLYDFDSVTGLLKSVTNPRMKDEFLKPSTVNLGNQLLSSNEYLENNGNLRNTSYGNGHSIEFLYDKFDRIIVAKRMDNSYCYKYDNNGNIVKILINDDVCKYGYDIGKRLNTYRVNNFSIDCKYDRNDNVMSKRYEFGDRENSINNTFDNNDLLVNSNIDDNVVIYKYDSLGRIAEKHINDLVIKYSYVHNGRRTSELVSSLKVGDNLYSYKYDELGNITDIYFNDRLFKSYIYDDYNELIEEFDYEKALNLQFVYDNNGNLLTKCIRDFENNVIIKTDSYLYENLDWEDQLTKFNDLEIVYDEIGNPLTIGSDISLSWINGRSLKTYSDVSNNLSVSYKYNVDGVRTEKVVNGKKINYYLEGTNVIYEERGADLIHYLYDSTGVIGLEYNNSTYLFKKNLQSYVLEVIGINNLESF